MAQSSHILPSLLTNNELTFSSRLHLCKGNVDMVHIDITDGRFVADTSWADPRSINAMKTPLRYELHLMVEDPLASIQQWKNVRNVGRIIVHAESQKIDITTIHEHARTHDWQIGAGFKLDSNPMDYEPLVQELNPTHVLCMGIQRIGFSGQKMDMPALELLVTSVKNTFAQSTTWEWIIDGGVKKENMSNLKQLGFTTFVLTSEIFDASDPKKRIQELQTLIQ